MVKNAAAIREFDAVLKSFPGRIDALVGRASAEIATGAYGPAAKDLRQAVQENWTFSRTASGANGTARSINDEVLSLGRTLAAAQPGLVDAHIALSDVYMQQGDRERALSELDLAITADPGSTDAYLRRSRRYQERGNTDQAVADLDQAVRLRPDSSEMLNQRCWVRATAGRLDAALPDCNASLKLSPSASAYDSRGLVHLKAGRNALAIDDYTAALKLDPKYASALYGRGLARKGVGDAAGAAEDIAAAKQIRSDIEQGFGR